MEVLFHPTPELQVKLDRWTAETGLTANELQDALATYSDAFAPIR